MFRIISCKKLSLRGNWGSVVVIPYTEMSVLNRVGRLGGVGPGPGMGNQNWMKFGTHTQHTLLGMHTKFHPRVRFG